MKKLTTIIIACAMATAAAAAAPTFEPGYKPFFITSTKYQRSVSDAVIVNTLLCKPISETKTDFKQLMDNFDLIETHSPRPDMEMATFKGIQDNKPVEVTLTVDTRSERTIFIMVGATPQVACR